MKTNKYLPYEDCVKITKDGYIPPTLYAPIYYNGGDNIDNTDFLIYDDDAWAVTQEQWDEFYSNKCEDPKDRDAAVFDRFIGKCFMINDNFAIFFAKVLSWKRKNKHDVVFTIDSAIVAEYDKTIKSYHFFIDYDDNVWDADFFRDNTIEIDSNTFDNLIKMRDIANNILLPMLPTKKKHK